MTRWIKHMLAVDVEIQPLTEMRDVKLNWYLGLDAVGTKLAILCGMPAPLTQKRG